MGQRTIKRLRRPIKKATKKQKKALADNVIAIRQAYNIELYNMSFKKRVSAAWDIIRKGKGK